MLKRTVVMFGLVAMTLGALSVLTPATETQADPQCVACPAIFIECGPCATHHPQTCKQCQYCKPIPNCTP